MPDSEEPKQANNNDLRNAQFGGGLINAESVKAERIGGDIYNIYLGQQQVASDNPSPSPNQRQRLPTAGRSPSQNERDSLEKAYALQSQKVERIRNTWLIETNPSRKFQYEHQLQEEERTLKELGDKLNAIEQYLQSTVNLGLKADTGIYVERSLNQKPRNVQLRIQNFKQDFDKLEIDYKAVAEKKRRESNPQEQNNLQLQLDSISKNMEEIESQLNELEDGYE